jgi:hypothetical protein
MTQVFVRKPAVFVPERQLHRGQVFVDCAVCGGPAEITRIRAKSQRAFCDAHLADVAPR